MTHIDRNQDRRHRLPAPSRLPTLDAQRLHRAIDCGAAIEGPYKKRIHRRQWLELVRYMVIVLMLMMTASIPFFART